MNFLVTGTVAGAEAFMKKLKEAGHNAVFMQYENGELPCDYSFCEGIICNFLFKHHNIEKFTNLKYLQLTSAGYDRIDIDYVKKHGITLFNAGDVYSIPMAEFAISGVLQLYKKSSFFYGNKSEHKWEKNREIKELYGKRVCVVGCGNVGRESAKRFKGFGCRVYGVNRTVREDECFDKILPLSELASETAKADIVLISIAKIPETEKIISEDIIKALKKDAVLINLARGEIVDETALIKALETYEIFGAVLDVFECDPLCADSPLWELENVVLTPHNSFIGENNADRMHSLIFENMKKSNV